MVRSKAVKTTQDLLLEAAKKEVKALRMFVKETNKLLEVNDRMYNAVEELKNKLETHIGRIEV